MNSSQATTSLNAQPNWNAAAQSLIDSLAVLSSDDERIDFLETLCQDLGKHLYPAFIHMLFYVERSGTRRAQELVGKTLVSCLLSGRVPSGETSAWGAAAQGLSPSNNTGGFTHQRRLGPIEFLVAWQTQPAGISDLSNPQFIQALTSLLNLINADQQAASLYRQHIDMQLEDPVGGAFNRSARDALNSLSRNWESNLPTHTVAERCLQDQKATNSLNHVVPR